MTRSEIAASIRRLIAEHQKATPRLDVVAFTEEAELVGDLGFDSLDVVEFHLAIEAEFDAEFGDDFADEVKSIGGVIDYLAKRLGAEAVVA